MTSVLIILALIAAAGVVAVLLGGFFVMAKGGETGKKYSNKLMQARIYLQAAAVGLFVLALLAAKH